MATGYMQVTVQKAAINCSFIIRSRIQVGDERPNKHHSSFTIVETQLEYFASESGAE
jgi:hypothetical protein